MSRKPRLNFDPSGDGLNSAFAGLNGAGLPEGKLLPPSPDPSKAARPSKFGRVVLRRETAHRGGKTVIVVYDFAPNIGLRYIEELAGKLKSACACGGTTRERLIEIQGDQPAKIRALLEAEGFQVAGVK